ncbi:MAG: hypothetical protein P0111_03985 [Nitrospira sp.]|nr:hypothetical protein [Nitrospira sp.]
MARAIAVITGERGRKYPPAIRSLELLNRDTNERFLVETESDDSRFMVSLPPGKYELNRVHITEGPFMSMAQLNAQFSISDTPITYLGTWRFGIDSPKYGRMVAVSIIEDDDERADAVRALEHLYPDMTDASIVTILPEPSEQQVRLYEVAPYPRIPRYFRRHWW